MKALVIAEKPSVARDIGRVLKCTKNGSGFLEGGQYVVTWGLGHLVTLADPEDYDPKYKTWKMEDLPMMPEHFKLEVIRQTQKQYHAVKSQIHRKDIGEIIIATDAGREGELVARLILEKAGSKKPVKRLWISSVTDKAIREGFAHLRRGEDYKPLYDAALCRAEADWLVGMNATRALTCKYNAQLSCGRVQTPTLAIVAKQEEKIRKFVPETFYGLNAYTKGITLMWSDQKSGSSRTFDKNRIQEIKKKVTGKEAVITEMKTSRKKTFPPLLYDLTELQKDAYRRFGFSPKETLNIMQRLYENHKVLTYPRTDSRYISSDIVPTLKDRVQACAVGPYRKAAGKVFKGPFTKDAPFVNDKKVSDHHAIIPTEQFVQLEHMTGEERKIYDLVIKRFLAALYPPAEFEEIKITAVIEGETFTAKGRKVLKEGWREVYSQEEDPDEEQDMPKAFPPMEKGKHIQGLSFTVTEGKTKPPARFNEGTLLAAMESPAAYMETQDKKAAKTLGETGGLGTVATRADIIDKLFGSFLLEKKGSEIYLTSKAKQLLELVPEDLKKPELTADWEMKLSRIADGKMKRGTFMHEIRDYANSLTEEIRTGEGTFRHDNLTNTKCPVCGKRMLKVQGKKSEMLVCQDRECGHREVLARVSNARCPNCHKKMMLRGQGDGQVFVCACGYKEKLSAFKERRKKEGAGVSKKDVQKYLNKQKDEPVNLAFAEAFAKLKLDE
ncbi:MAG TPA: DNA topoisomerase III [Candidatus Dorea faecipullorum]|nr:DNA topoisomerase III [Candidatus Dorea faecipullorum]